ncbi:MAG: hypothetical protein GW772_04040 [Flavobacteriia bacterium]|nr:hypothetical protein [Flavobacteriia bacterium]OIP48795.1 MAG: hypothetical protein AUK46_00550 [Flavobacteriaceae bacterium CG2_30_31_66]PIV95515.1 MAG: hypothetical protein COW43_13375 [Flavobacteriaceae bacterium CG17_big_fil_post_rev_8_21_14_2_50_31_13]PIX14436.1 MAG: hypothetical protein COZ74_02990 [Flavobacteriaceae bacterium CG_4_8_14_3_um_filter_31_8]PIY14224.1 MAG: hypothetical protein COZ16_10535 [Flavobacteriaceae bacterium CG_4_10_14_3_um_filter_31_253]PIZ10333.1 MAG: hypotheti
MESVNIEKLIEKYLEGNTSLQEETILKNYFNKGIVAPNLQEYQPLFTYYVTAKNERYSKTIELSPKKIKRNYTWLSIAASIALLVSVFIGKQQYELYQQKQEAERLFAELSKGLRLISTNLKKGEQAVATLYTLENTVNKIVK